MIETCARFGLLTQFMSVSAEDKVLTFSALYLRSEQQIKSLQFMTNFEFITILLVLLFFADALGPARANAAKKVRRQSAQFL